MKKLFYTTALAVIAFAGCGKQGPEDENAWIHDESRQVPVLFGSATNIDATTKAIQHGLVTGSVMNTLDVGVVGVAEKQSDATLTAPYSLTIWELRPLPQAR